MKRRISQKWGSATIRSSFLPTYAIEQLEPRWLLSVAPAAYSIIAETGEAITVGQQTENLTSIDSNVSLNDAGNAAFAATVTGGSVLLTGSGGAVSLVSFPPASNRTYSFADINDAGTVVGAELITGPSYVIRAWYPATGTNSIVAMSGGSGPLGKYASVLVPSLANDGGVEFIGLTNGGSQASVFFNPTETQGNDYLLLTGLTGGGYRPMAGNGGLVVIRAGGTTTSPIELGESGQPSFPTTIASTSMGYSALGADPGISPDGKVVAFYAVNSQGQGLFLSSGGVTQSVVGVGPGSAFIALSADTRVAVTGLPTPGHATEMAFEATGADGKIGLYTAALSAGAVGPGSGLGITVSAATLVVEQGSAAPGLTGTVQNFSVYNPLDAAGDVAFWVADSNGNEAVLRYRPLGVDVSNVGQGMLDAEDWSGVAAAGTHFALVKATQGRTFQDPQFVDNMTNASAVGILTAAYHFAAPNLDPSDLADEAESEADNFVSLAGPYLQAGELQPALDLEPGSSSAAAGGGCVGLTFAQIAEWATYWIADVQADLPTLALNPILYMSKTYASGFQGVSPSLTGYKLWIADYSVPSPDPAPNIGPWSDWAIMQYTKNGTDLQPWISTADEDLLNPDTTFTNLQIARGNASATIDSATVSPGSPAPDGPVTVTLNVSASEAMNLLIGASIAPQGGGNSIILTPPLLANFQSGKNSSNYRFNIPANQSPGTYNLTVQLYQDTNGDGLIDVGDVQLAIGNNIAMMSIAAPESVINAAPGDHITLIADSSGQYSDWNSNEASGSVPDNFADGLTINSIGGNSVLAIDLTNGNPLPEFVHLNGTFTITGLFDGAGSSVRSATAAGSVFANTTIDIGRSTVYIGYTGSPSPAALIQQTLSVGYNDGAWNGIGTGLSGAITSLAAASGPANAFGVGYADSADGLVVGQPANTVEIRYTVMGDANLDGVVNASDALLMTRNWGATGGAAWDRGDFNYDGVIDFGDAAILQKNWNVALAEPASAAPAVGSPAGTDGGAAAATGGGPVAATNVPVTGDGAAIAPVASAAGIETLPVVVSPPASEPVEAPPTVPVQGPAAAPGPEVVVGGASDSVSSPAAAITGAAIKAAVAVVPTVAITGRGGAASLPETKAVGAGAWVMKTVTASTSTGRSKAPRTPGVFTPQTVGLQEASDLAANGIEPGGDGEAGLGVDLERKAHRKNLH